jgi:CubicO group peptidase (beta-lactamase class C family)
MDPGPHTRAEALSVTAAWDVPDVCAVAIDGAGRVDSSGDIHHRYRLASVTKLLSTYAVLVAVEEASLALDTPAGPNGATIAHLLAHASGMGPDPDSLLAGVEQRRIYSTESFAIIAKAVADATAMSWSDYLTQAVLEPLAMADTDVSGHPGSGAVNVVRGDPAVVRQPRRRPARIRTPRPQSVGPRVRTSRNQEPALDLAAELAPDLWSFRTVRNDAVGRPRPRTRPGRPH